MFIFRSLKLCNKGDICHNDFSLMQTAITLQLLLLLNVIPGNDLVGYIKLRF